MDNRFAPDAFVVTDEEALEYHRRDPPGKVAIAPTKPVLTRQQLALAYSPGVAAAVRAIAADPDTVYDYTNRANLVAVATNGTAILGLGDMGALAAKPVMEGKAVLFKRFADVDAIDLNIDARDPDTFIEAVRYLGPTFGGINLEDIKAPECFVIEARLRELMDIPVFHDDQHGTAIIAAAGLLNACLLTKRETKSLKIVINGAGAAGIACAELFKALGARDVMMCDRTGPITTGRDGLNQWKAGHAHPTSQATTLAEAMVGADVFLGVSVKGALTPAMVASMNASPIIFALANPDPEIDPAAARAVRSDAIIATGRSDYPNQVNNVLCFPYIFRGALDVRARAINEEMKMACAQALAELAREDVPDEVADAFGGSRPRFGPNYIIPAIFDPRLILTIPPAVARAAIDSGVARKPLATGAGYRNRLAARQDPLARIIQRVMDQVRANPRRVIFAEGEEEASIRAAIAYRQNGLGEPLLVGRPEQTIAQVEAMGMDPKTFDIRVESARTASGRTAPMAEALYARLQRRGFLLRDCQRMVNNNRNVFAAALIQAGEADAMITGITRNYTGALEDVSMAIDPVPGRRLIGVSLALSQGRAIIIADTNIALSPDANALADIAQEAAHAARRLGLDPKVAFLSHSSFGYREDERARAIRQAMEILRVRHVDFPFDGEMSPDVALSEAARKSYPFSRLKESANVLIMPSLHAATISTRMLRAFDRGVVVLGPLLMGFAKPVQIVHKGCGAGELTQMAALAAFDIGAPLPAGTSKTSLVGD